jgi:hypothetical protein
LSDPSKSKRRPQPRSRRNWSLRPLIGGIGTNRKWVGFLAFIDVLSLSEKLVDTSDKGKRSLALIMDGAAGGKQRLVIPASQGFGEIGADFRATSTASTKSQGLATSSPERGITKDFAPGAWRPSGRRTGTVHIQGICPSRLMQRIAPCSCNVILHIPCIIPSMTS